MIIPGGILLLILDIACCYHVVRSGREIYWLYLILIFQPFGAIIYLVAIILPELLSGRGRKMGRAAIRAIDPNRGYREAQQAVEDSPTVFNRMALGEAAVELGRYDEAAHIYRLCLEGVYSDDPVLLMRYAVCLVELGRFREALTPLNQLGELGDVGRTPQAALLLGRAHEGLGEIAEADDAYAWAAGRLTGPEGHARYAAFLAAQNRPGEAESEFAQLEKRVKRAPRAYRREATAWRDFAAAAMAEHGVAKSDKSAGV